MLLNEYINWFAKKLDVQKEDYIHTFFFKFFSQKSQKFRTLVAYLPAFEFELWTGDSTAHEQIIRSKTTSHRNAHEQTILRSQLFAVT